MVGEPPAQSALSVLPVSKLAATSSFPLFCSTPAELPESDAEEVTQPVLLTVTVTLLAAPGSKPITVIKPLDEIDALPPLEAEISHWNVESWLVT